MFGVPADLDLSQFKGAELTQIAIGAWDLQLNFEPAKKILITGHWELKDSAGKVIDQAQDHGSRESYKIHRLLGRVVAEYTISSPKSFTLTFDDGMSMTVFDDSDRYESVCIQPGNIII